MSMNAPPNSGQPTPVQGVTGGPPVLGGAIQQDPVTGAIILTPNPANVVQIRKGASPQALQIYEYFNSPTDFSRLSLNTSPSGYQIAIESQPPSVVRPLDIIANGPVRINGATIAVLPITQLYSAIGVVSGPTTASASAVDLPDMTLTFPAGGGRVFAWFSGACSNDTLGQGTFMQFALDGTTIAQTRRIFVGGVASQAAAVNLLHDFGVLSVASHTIKVQWGTTGTGTTTSALQQRELIIAEIRA